jgi:hypothetical protein
MAEPFQIAGAQGSPSEFAPIHVNRMATGYWTNTSPLRDASTEMYTEKFYGGRGDRIGKGVNVELSTRLTLRRRPGLSVYNSQVFPGIISFYGWNTFTLTDESVRVLVDTADTVYDGTGPDNQQVVWEKSPGAGPTYFLGVGNTLYFTNGVENMQLNNTTGVTSKWGIQAPTNAPTVSQQPRPNPPPGWQAATAYPSYGSPRAGMLILDDSNTVANFSIIPLQNGGRVAIGCGQNAPYGSTIQLPPGFTTANMLVWTTAAVAGPGGNTSGVYESSGINGVLTSSFQNTSGGLGFNATTNWIAIAWDTTSGIVPTTNGNYSQITFITALGDSMAILVGQGANGDTVPVPSGFTIATSVFMAGMVGTSRSTNHIMQGIQTCAVGPSTGVIQNNYNDNDGNTWTGTTGVLAIYGAGRITVAPATNCNVMLVPVTASDQYLSLLFAVNLPQNQSFGISGQSVASSTCAMAGWTPSFSNHGEGYSCLCNSTTFVGYYFDGSGNKWAANGNCFAMTAYNVPSSGNVQVSMTNGVTGTKEPQPWNPTAGDYTTDNTVQWLNLGNSQWAPNTNYGVGAVVMGNVTSPPGTPPQFFVCTTPGPSGTQQPTWVAGVGLLVGENVPGGAVWTCQGRALSWNDIGANTQISGSAQILDPNGYLENVASPGKSGNTIPKTFSTQLGAFTTDNGVVWVNAGPWAVAGTDTTQYGYAYENSSTLDISNMSPPSPPITLIEGNQVVVQGQGSADPQVDTVPIYRTAQGGATFLLLATVPNPGAGQTWTYIDNLPDSALNVTIQAQVLGEGTPLPIGATCLAYHVGRIWAGVGNVVYGSSGPDAVASGSSGNAGFDLAFTCQSKVIRFWVTPMGLIIFTLRDAYIITGDGAPTQLGGTPFVFKTFIENLPLLNYNAFGINFSTAYMLSGHKMVYSLDPSAGILEASFPIADQIAALNPATSYATYHHGTSGENALYVSDGSTLWYRMAPTSMPEPGTNWNPPAYLTQGCSAVQSTETAPGTMTLLIGPPTGTPGPILQRDTSVNTDNGTPFPLWVQVGNIVLANSGQLAGLAWVGLESVAEGSATALAVMLDEIKEIRGSKSAYFAPVPRTRQDPPNLPPSESLFSNRHNLLQSQKPVWCKSLQMLFYWPEEDAANELLTYTIFGQIWQEHRSE